MHGPWKSCVQELVLVIYSVIYLYKLKYDTTARPTLHCIMQCLKNYSRLCICLTSEMRKEGACTYW
jgi:hypothetical protein